MQLTIIQHYARHFLYALIVESMSSLQWRFSLTSVEYWHEWIITSYNIMWRELHILSLNSKPVNSSPLSTAYIRRWIGYALVQIMACRLLGTKPLSIPMLGYYQLGTIFSELLIKIRDVSFTKMHLKTSSAKWWPIGPGGDELIYSVGMRDHSYDKNVT